MNKADVPSMFLQLHFLTVYPPANLNRDDLGRPKTAMLGGSQRLRISSQSLKRAWRTSSVFQDDVVIGTRTKRIGRKVFHALEDTLGEKKADAVSKKVAAVFGKPKSKKGLPPEELRDIEQLAHLSRAELANIDLLVERLKNGETVSESDYENLLSDGHGTPDIALFGRMLADDPEKNVDAAAQVGHAISIHSAPVEEDYFTAVDDLNRGDEETGAAHLGTNEFGAGVFYHYVCVSTHLLKEHLDGESARKTVQALVKACTQIAPTGKQNSYGSRGYASYLLAEFGSQEPRSLIAAFLKPVRGPDYLGEGIDALESTRDSFDQVFGQRWDRASKFNVPAREGSLRDVLQFVVECL